MRTVANAVAMGTTTGMMVNKEIILENFWTTIHESTDAPLNTLMPEVFRKTSVWKRFPISKIQNWPVPELSTHQASV